MFAFASAPFAEVAGLFWVVVDVFCLGFFVDVRDFFFCKFECCFINIKESFFSFEKVNADLFWERAVFVVIEEGIN